MDIEADLLVTIEEALHGAKKKVSFRREEGGKVETYEVGIPKGVRAGQKILVVTHGGTLRCFRFLLERWDYARAAAWPEGQAPANCGVTTYRCADSGDHGAARPGRVRSPQPRLSGPR